MASKLTASLLLGGLSARQTTLADLRSHHHVPEDSPNVESLYVCDSAVKRMHKGPEDWEPIIEKGEQYTDQNFKRKDQLYWPFFTKWDLSLSMDMNLMMGKLNWDRLNNMYPDSTLWGSNPNWHDVIQGAGGTCYILAAMAALSEYPDLVKQVFVTQEKNSAGIYAIRFFIRGKPWLVTVDDEILVQDSSPFYARTGKNNSLWGPILEKAWAKVKGSYANADLGFYPNGIRSLVGCPVYYYNSADQTNAASVWMLAKDSNAADYLMGAGTAGSSDTQKTEHNIAAAHQYSLIDAFSLLDTNGALQHRMFMLRNPWGKTTYNGNWNADDSKWTAAYKAQVPHGVDPTTSDVDGIFFVEDSDFLQVFSDFQIAHYKDDMGYTDDIYDHENDLGFAQSYTFTVPEQNGDMYFTVDSYFQSMVPMICSFMTTPITKLSVYINDAEEPYKMMHYYDQFSYPILVKSTDYKQGDNFKITVDYNWNFYPTKDYTVKVYSKHDIAIRDAQGKTSVCHMDGTWPSCFTESTYQKDRSITSEYSEGEFEPHSLWDVYRVSYSWDSFWEIVGKHPWTLGVWWWW